MVFLKTLLIILLVYFGIKLLAKYFGPMLIKYVFRKVQRKMENQFNPGQQESRSTSNSKTSSNRFKTKSNKKSKVGEYVDYEEIE
jgi:hypothetical protein